MPARRWTVGFGQRWGEEAYSRVQSSRGSAGQRKVTGEHFSAGLSAA